MRKDMEKLLCERPRVGGGHANAGRRAKVNKAKIRRDDEGFDCHAPTQETMKAQWKRGSSETKSLNENLAPLFRFLHSQVGRPWDKVYSDIKAHVRFDKATQYHILQHLWGYVELNPIMVDGKPHTYGYNGLSPLGRFGIFDSLYVCPKSGLLKATPNRPKKKADPKPITKATIDGQRFDLIDGIWYRTKWKKLPDATPKKVTASSWDLEKRDYVTKERMVGPTDVECLVNGIIRSQHISHSRDGHYSWQIVCDHYRAAAPTSYCTNKKQANSKEIRRIEKSTEKVKRAA